MANGISIHIGLNYIDSKHYGHKGELPFCVNDAGTMAAIAKDKNYLKHVHLYNKEATATNVLTAINKAADELVAGDILLLTYSGHGYFFPDQNGDEPDKYDEAWVLYDRLLIDDELYYCWSKFAAGVRIVMVSDSCHSGTMAKPLFLEGAEERSGLAKSAYTEILKSEASDFYKSHKDFYDRQVRQTPSPKTLTIGASVILLASCGDKQSSLAKSISGRELSLFTDRLLTVYELRHPHTYATFLRAIKQEIPAKYHQKPNYYEVGKSNSRFVKQDPFSI